MKLALGLASRGLGQVWPNPAVGCVIVNANRIVGRGWTQSGGRPHAETVALAQAGDAAKGATAYVTLEPCAHHGKTPPCSEALIAAGISRVVIALEDPDERVDGNGVAKLQDAGIAVEVGTLSSEAKRINKGFLTRVTQGRPIVTLKLATSFDGRIATASGESKWITGVESRRMVHAMRARHDAVMVGGGTGRADDPSLTVRGLGVRRQPVRIVWSRNLDLPLNGQLAHSAAESPFWICHGADAAKEIQRAWKEIGARLVSLPVTFGHHLDVVAGLQALGDAGLTRVFCEGGGTLAASLLAADVVDELIGFTAGLALGSDGRPAIGSLDVARLAIASRFQLQSARKVGADVMHTWTRKD